MSVHVCTTDSFFVDAIPFKGLCLFCGRNCEHEMGWVSSRCKECGQEFSSDWGRSYFVRRCRSILGYTPTQMADATGYAKSTIETYEWRCCSHRYLRRCQELTMAALT